MLKNKGYYYFSILLLTTIILIIIASGVRYLVNERDTPKIPKIAQDKNASILLKQKGLWVNVVKDFHADKTGKTDSTLAIEKAIKFAQSKRIPLYFPSNGIYKVTHTLNIDISKTALLSNGATLDFRNLADETAIHLYSTVNYNNRFLNTKKALDGIYIIGSIDPVNKLQGKTGLLLGDSKFNSDNFSIEHCAIDGFDNNIRFTDNAWRISFSHIQSRWGSVYAPPGLKNMGENINFEDCMFADALADVQLYTGSFHFSHTSFDNSTLRLGGNATAHVISSHFENPGSRNPTKRFVSIESPDSQVFLTDVDILLNKPQNGDYKSALFYVLNANRDRGLVINDINLSFWNYYKPYINDNLATLVAGGGRVQFKGGFISEINGVKSNGYIVSQSLNVVFNGDAEGDNTNGWKVSGQGNFSIDKNVHKNGEGSFKIDVNSGQSLNIKQEFRVRPSQTILCQYWQKSLIRGQNTLFSVKIDFYTKNGTYISSLVGNSTSKTVDWTNVNNIKGVSPTGTDHADISISAQNPSPFPSKLWIDDLIINVL